MKLSIVSPVYLAESIIPELVERVIEALEGKVDSYELILVDDRGPDNSWEAIKSQCAKHPFVKGIKLSRNFGQHYAVSAGIAHATGENIVLMDCDLQDSPNDILKLLEKRGEGFEIVFTKRKNRKHGFLKSLSAKIYNRLFKFFAEQEFDVNAGSLVLFSERVGREFSKLEDKDRLYIQLLKWLGFSSAVVEVEHQERFEGKSSYSFVKLLEIAVQGWTSHSDKLLRISVYIGFVLSLISILGGVGIIIQYFLHGFMTGWPSIIVSILFSTGLILLSIGVMGIYVGKIFEQSKNRPLYIVEEEVNLSGK